MNVQLTVSDVMAKWEKYEQHGINPEGDRWRLVFKLFAYFAPRAKDLSPMEQDFLFEQAFDNVINRRFPADEVTQIKLAALRTQVSRALVVGDAVVVGMLICFLLLLLCDCKAYFRKVILVQNKIDFLIIVISFTCMKQKVVAQKHCTIFFTLLLPVHCGRLRGGLLSVGP